MGGPTLDTVASATMVGPKAMSCPRITMVVRTAGSRIAMDSQDAVYGGQDCRRTRDWAMVSRVFSIIIWPEKSRAFHQYQNQKVLDLCIFEYVRSEAGPELVGVESTLNHK